MIRKFLAVLITLVMILSLPVTGMAYDSTSPSFSVSSASGECGENVVISVNINNNPGIISYKLGILYDASALELVSSEAAGLQATFGDPSKNPFITSWVDAIHGDNTYNGSVAKLTFKIRDNAAAGNYNISLSYDADDVFDSNFDNVYFETEGGVVTVKEPVIETEPETQPTEPETEPETSGSDSEDGELLVHIEAEDFVSSTGTVAVAAKTYEDSQFINTIANGNTVTYTADFAKAGNYTAGIRASYKYAGIRPVNVYIDGVLSGVVNIEGTDDWALFKTFTSDEMFISKGTHTIMLEAVKGGFNANWIEFTGREAEGDTPEDYSIHFEAEDYISMSGVAVSDKVDQGTPVLSSVDKNDYMEYSIKVAAAGIYQFNARASRTDTAVGVVTLSENGNVLATCNIERTGSWTTYNDFEGTFVKLTEGEYTFRVTATTGRYNISWFELEYIGTGETEDDEEIIVHVEAEDYTSMSGVTISDKIDCGTPVLSSVDKNDYMVYSVEIPASGTYKFNARASRTDTAVGILTLKENGKDIAACNVERTGSWTTFNDFEGTEVYLSEGTHNLTVAAATGRYNISYFEFVCTAKGEQEEVSKDIHIEAESYVSMSGVGLKGTFEQGTDVVNSVDAGDYMIYTVEVPETAAYKFVVRASRTDASVSTISLMENDKTIATCGIGKTGSWTTFNNFEGTEVKLTAGTHTFKVYANGGRYNLNWYELCRVE